MRIRARGALTLALLAPVVIVASQACGGLFRQYEYEEEMYLALDGSASIYVNSSLAALNALRGASFDTSSPDRDAVRALYTTPLTRVVGRVTTSSRAGRRFVHVRVDVNDVRKLHEAAPFSWSAYQFGPEGDLLAYKQTVGAAAGTPVSTNWTGEEWVGFRIHLPSKVQFHDNLSGPPRRGNILVWEQRLSERLEGTPLVMETKVETESILYRTLILFALTAVAVTILFALVIWMIVRRGRRRPDLEVGRRLS